MYYIWCLWFVVQSVRRRWRANMSNLHSMNNVRDWVMPAQYLHKLVHSQRRYVVFLSELCKHNPNIMRMDVLHVLIWLGMPVQIGDCSMYGLTAHFAKCIAILAFNPNSQLCTIQPLVLEWGFFLVFGCNFASKMK